MPYLKEIVLQCYKTQKESIHSCYVPPSNEDIRSFHYSVEFIQDLYATNLNFKNQDVAKVCIMLVNSQNHPLLDKEKKLIYNLISIVQLIDIIEIHIYCNISEFNMLNDASQCSVTLDLIQQSVIAICELKGWDSTSFNAAYNKVLSLEFRNQGALGAHKRSPNRANSVQLHYTFGKYSYDLFLFLFDKKNNNIGFCLLYSAGWDDPFIYHIKDLNGKLEWIDNDYIRWTSKVDYDGSFTSKVVRIDEVALHPS